MHAQSSFHSWASIALMPLASLPTDMLGLGARIRFWTCTGMQYIGTVRRDGELDPAELELAGYPLHRNRCPKWHASVRLLFMGPFHASKMMHGRRALRAVLHWQCTYLVHSKCQMRGLTSARSVRPSCLSLARSNTAAKPPVLLVA